MKADRNNPVLQLQIKEREKAAKIILRETAAKEKAEVVAREKAAKELERAAEKERRLRLSPAEKKAEIIERKAEAALRKAAVLLLNADRLRVAMEMIGEQNGAQAQDVVGAEEMDAVEEEAEEMEAEEMEAEE
jgi:hypothetical protein